MKRRDWRGMPGGGVGLAGSRHSTLRDKIRELPDFVQRALDVSMGRAPVAAVLSNKDLHKPSRRPPCGPYDFVGGEAAARANQERRALERKLSGDIDVPADGAATKNHHPVSAAGRGGVGVGALDRVKLSRVKLAQSGSADGLARCLAGHAASQRRLLRVEELCAGVSAPRLGGRTTHALVGRRGGGAGGSGASRPNRMTGGAPEHLRDYERSPKLSRAEQGARAKKRWGKVRNVMRAGIGLAAAAAATRGGLDEASVLSQNALTRASEHAGEGGAIADMTNNRNRNSYSNGHGNNNASSGGNNIRLRPRRSPRLPDGRIVPPWMAPPGYALPLTKAVPRDIALLRVCRIPREWAEQWLSGRDVDDAAAAGMRTKQQQQQQRNNNSPMNKNGSGGGKRSTMSWDAARVALPHAHTYLFRATGRFVTSVLDRRRVLALLRKHPMGPSPSTLAQVVQSMKAERPLDDGPGPATFDRTMSDGATSLNAPRAVMSSSVGPSGSLPPGGHEHALYHELRSIAPGPGSGAYVLSNGFGDRPIAGGALGTTTHLSTIPVTPGKAGLAVATPSANGGPGAGAYNTRPSSPGGGVKWSEPPPVTFHEKLLRENMTPAPHDYDVRRGEALLSTTRHQTTGGVIAGRDKSELDRQLLAASKRPGPQDYAPRLPSSVRGVPRMSTSFGPSEIERVALRAAETPGPGLYFMSTGSRPPHVLPAGAPRFKDGNYHTPLDLIMARAKETPGPGAHVKWKTLSQYPSADLQVSLKYPSAETREEAELRRRGKLPGPAKYADAFLGIRSARMAGGRFSTAYPETELDTIQRLSATTPGPAEYHHQQQQAGMGPLVPGNPSDTQVAAERRIRGATIGTRLPTMTELAYRRGLKTPGAGAVVDDAYTRKRHGVAKMSESNAKTDVEWAMHRAAQTPGPGAIVDITATRPSPGGGRFNTGNAKSDLEWAIHRAKRTPGPAAYNLNDRATRVNFGSAIISESSARNGLEEAIFQAKQRPGPADYQPDPRTAQAY
jgi:hypothetical protein